MSRNFSTGRLNGTRPLKGVDRHIELDAEK
jgi:hypothetical protein